MGSHVEKYVIGMYFSLSSFNFGVKWKIFRGELPDNSAL